MTQPQAWRKWVAVPLIALGGAVTLLAQLPVIASVQSLGPVVLWFQLSMLGLFLLVGGAIADRGALRLAGLVLIALALGIDMLMAQRLFGLFRGDMG